MEYKDYYKIIGVDKTASQDDIKRAYRKLARKYHPDVSKEANAEERFKELGEAYEVLKDPEKRTAYDQLGENWKAGQDFNPPPNWDEGFEFHGGGFTQGSAEDFSDFFESLFGQRGGFQQAYTQTGRPADNYASSGQDSHAKVLIDLEDSYRGTSRLLTLHATELGADGLPRLKERTLTIKIPKGVKQGQHIRLQGQGNPAIGSGSPGDLYLEIEFNPHSYYHVEGRDVYFDLPITPWEAALGSSINVSIPDGDVEMKIPPGSSSGRKLRIKGRGIPGKIPGDFYVTLKIIIPDTTSPEAKALYEQLQKLHTFNPRTVTGA